MEEIKKEIKQEHTQPQKYTYATLQETNDEECESWLVFIRYQGNEEALNHLQEQLKQVDWELMDGLSVFEMELDFLVSEQTAKEMTKIDLNSQSFHRKFDGKLEKIDLGFKAKSSTRKKMRKATDILGYGGIEDYIDQEDLDPEDLNETDEKHEESEESEDSESSESSQSSVSSRDEHKKNKHKKTGKLPQVVINKIKEEQKKRK
jgi:hypothetical protein